LHWTVHETKDDTRSTTDCSFSPAESLDNVPSGRCVDGDDAVGKEITARLVHYA
jgi:hypothetical protein